ncbi:MAG: rubredoxin [Clostridia bacterium]|nr:rubredoxin [Clostridia bacterium]
MDTKALHAISYGLYIVTAKKGERLNGQVANTVFQITSDPPTLAVGINKKNLTHEFIQAGRSFAVSVLAKEAPLSLIGRFGFKSGREVDKLSGINYRLTSGGLPYLTEHSLAYLEARVEREIDVGTHSIFIGALTDAAVLLKGDPMTYAYYHQVKRGTTPRTAPTFAAARAEAQPIAAAKYQCSVCGYTYDPAQGDPERGIAPGTPFEELPADWTCPVCGVGKDSFERA